MNESPAPRGIGSPLPRLVMTALIAALAITLVPLAQRQGAEQVASQPAAPMGEKLEDFGLLPEFQLTTQEAQQFTRDSLKGKTWIFDFVFTRCSGPCPVMSARMRGLQDKLAGDAGIRLASISVDPKNDTPEALTRYAADLDADAAKWVFLTGTKEGIFSLSRDGFKLGVQENDPSNIDTASMPLLHSTRFVLVDGSGTIRGYFDGTDEEAMARLVIAARNLEARVTP